MIWVTTGSVCVVVFLLCFCAMFHVYSGAKWFAIIGVTLLYGVCAYCSHLYVFTNTIYDTVIVVRKREEEVERTEKWTTVIHYLIADDGLEYWVPINLYKEIKAGDEVEVVCTYYEGKIKDNRLRRFENGY